MTSNRHTGKVKWFSEEKGYGFIQPDDGSKDIFVHKTGVAYGLKMNPNDSVSYEITTEKGKISAVNLKNMTKEERNNN